MLERERARLSSDNTVVLLRFGDSRRLVAGALPFVSISRGRERLEARDGRRFADGLGGGDASVAYGDPGIGARGCPRSYERGDTWAAAKRSLDIDRRRACFLAAGLGEAFGEGTEFKRAVE